jgi:hypothetical protein
MTSTQLGNLITRRTTDAQTHVDTLIPTPCESYLAEWGIVWKTNTPPGCGPADATGNEPSHAVSTSYNPQICGIATNVICQNDDQ